MSLHTPNYQLTDYPEVYEPSEDTFLLLDALETEIGFLKKLKPQLAVEIGSGSGVVITAFSTIFGNNCACFATDINPEACSATQKTSILNSVVAVDCVNMDMLFAFRNNLFDVILFNPPYVVSDPKELDGNGLNRAWAGGKNGREITDKLLYNLQDFLTDTGVCYVVLLKQNNVGEVRSIMYKRHFKTELILDRRTYREHLYVMKITKLT